jgi:predicted nuclease of predicted toxin-antitoxin system
VRFFLDHDVPAEVAGVLRREGHQVMPLREALPVTASDLEVFRYAAAQDFFLITCNRDDFLPLATAGPNPGLIVLIRRRSRQAKCANLLSLFREAGERGLSGNINFA